MPVFSRTGPHVYDGALDELSLSMDVGDKAMARNLMHDHRVSVIREGRFDKVGCMPRDRHSFVRGIYLYVRAAVQTRTLPDFVYENLNGHNIVLGGTDRHRILSPGRLLARVLDLNGLYPIYQWAQSLGILSWPGLPASYRDVDVANWLDRILGGGDPAMLSNFVQHVLTLMAQYRRVAPYQPVWATTWDELAPSVADGPDRWCELVGIRSPSVGRWKIVLKYRAEEAGTIARPTQLDAGWYAEHFPSPPAAAAAGHPMDLHDTLATTELRTEFIHRAFDHSLRHWIDGGSLIGRTTRSSSRDLLKLRSRHRQALVKSYGSSHVDSWMPSVV